MTHPCIAFATMVGDEPIFLPIWIAYYSRFVPKSQLFILIDGSNRQIPPEAEGCQLITLPTVSPGPGWVNARWRMISHFVSMLVERFDIVAFNDVDELLVADPLAGTLPDLMSRAKELGVISPFAVEMLHRTDLEPAAVDFTQPILAQRQFARLNASYCKPCITSKPIRWTLGGHYADFPNLHLAANIYLFYLRFIDHEMLLARQASRQAMMTKAGDAPPVAGAGWQKDRKAIEYFLQSFATAGPPIDSNFDFSWQRKRIAKSWAFDATAGIWRHDKFHNRKTYRIPARFSSAF